jgi:hypothetical protein
MVGSWEDYRDIRFNREGRYDPRALGRSVGEHVKVLIGAD